MTENTENKKTEDIVRVTVRMRTPLYHQLVEVVREAAKGVMPKKRPSIDGTIQKAVEVLLAFDPISRVAIIRKLDPEKNQYVASIPAKLPSVPGKSVVNSGYSSEEAQVSEDGQEGNTDQQRLESPQDAETLAAIAKGQKLDRRASRLLGLPVEQNDPLKRGGAKNTAQSRNKPAKRA